MCFNFTRWMNCVFKLTIKFSFIFLSTFLHFTYTYSFTPFCLSLLSNSFYIVIVCITLFSGNRNNNTFYSLFLPDIYPINHIPRILKITSAMTEGKTITMKVNLVTQRRKEIKLNKIKLSCCFCFETFPYHAFHN